jgi:hypothetical protein
MPKEQPENKEFLIENIKSLVLDKSKELREHNKKIFRTSNGVLWADQIGDPRYYPILYLKKPKHLSEEEFQKLLDKLEITFKY